jgi:hypothetical protein
MAKRKSAALREEIPVEELGELAGNVPKVQIKLSRFNAANRRMSVGWSQWDTEKVGGPDFEKWITEEYGGGVYIVEVTSCDNTNERLVPAFKLNMPGEPKPTPVQQSKYDEAALLAAQRGQPMPNIATFMRSPQGHMPVRGDGKSMTVQPTGVNPKDVMTHTSDVAFKHQADNAEARLFRLEQKAEAETKEREKERREWEAERRNHLQQVADLRETHRKEEVQRERELWEAKMLAQNQGPKVDYAAILTALAPIIAAYMTSTKEQKALAQEEHFKTLEAQQKNADALMKMIASKAGGDSEMLKAIEPMLSKMLDADSPKAQASLITAMGDNQATMFSLVHQMMQANAPENPPYWLEFAQEAVGQIASTAKAVADTQRAKANGQPTPQALTSAAIPQQVTPVQQQMTPEQIADALLAHPQWPDDLKTDEWKQLVILIHEQHDAKVTAALLFERLDILDRRKETPLVFDGVWQDPGQVMGAWLGNMPIARIASPYAEELHKIFVQLIVDDNEANADQDEEDQEQESEPEHETTIVDVPPPDAQENQTM